MRRENLYTPYGYRYSNRAAANKKLLPFPMEQERLSYIVQMRDRGVSFNSIAKNLERVGIRKRNQRPFKNNSVYDIYCNHVKSGRSVIPLDVDNWYREMERKYNERERKKTERKAETERNEILKTIETIKQLVDRKLPIE